MAKGGGGEGHYDERRRAAAAAKPKKAATGYADSPEVLEAVVKPKSKPTVVVKKKKVVIPREKPSVSTAPQPRAAPIRPQNTGFVSPSVRSTVSLKQDLGGPPPEDTPETMGNWTPPALGDAAALKALVGARYGSRLAPQNIGFAGGPGFGGPKPNSTPDLTAQDSNFMRPDLRPQNTGLVTPTPQARARAKAGGGRRLEDMIDAYLKRARPGGGYP